MIDNYGELSREALIEVLRRRDRERKLGLVWERREIERDASINDDVVLLAYDDALSVADGPTRNLVIEGDNYDSLRWLRVTHRNRVRFIYIDPPYNRGNTTFVYNDRYVDPDDRYRHSTWLEFMYQRLRLARDLLAPDGLLFVSIDDEEMARLKLLLDIVFPGGFLANLIWQSDGNSDNQGIFKIKHEYILVYALDPSQIDAPPVTDPNLDEESKLFNDEKRNTIIKNGFKNPPSKILLPKGFPASFESGTIVPKTGPTEWPKHTVPLRVEQFSLAEAVEIESGWSSRRQFERFIDGDFLSVLDSQGQETRFELTPTGAIESFKPRSEVQSYVVSVIRGVGSVQKTKRDLERIGLRFDYPKPVGLLRYLLRMVPGNDFTALDFFAGTGTMGEAVMRLNAADNGKRSFILASSTEATRDDPDKNVCRDACARRLRWYFEHDGDSQRNRESELYGFTYARAQRIAVADIDIALTPAEAWAWIQRIHGFAPRRYDNGLAMQTIGDDATWVAYVDRVSDAAKMTLEQLAAARTGIVYAWSPGALRDLDYRLPVEVRAVPDRFVDHFVA